MPSQTSKTKTPCAHNVRALFLPFVALLFIQSVPLKAENTHALHKVHDSVAEHMETRSTAVVLDFENGTDGKVRKSVRKELAARFLDKLEEQDAFDNVLSEKQAKKSKRSNHDSAIVVAGVITHYQKRTANIRILVGVDEGISFFDTKIRLKPAKGSDGLQRGEVNAITLVEDTVVDQARDKGETVKEYVEDTAQLIAKAYRAESRSARKS